ncbi:nuclear transport factor 2 [Malania oleifera]|uniref:nuclear transport factor 2 n=1 Tax=Malania oleifera TaxID=397392 RepID=UPI0025AE54CA|nr:nuclear transport factor 2 [Malania oleifera]
MASSVQQQAAAGSPPSPQVVGNAFVQQYYHILHQSPQLVYRFYQDISKLGRPEDNGIMGSVSSMDAINEKVLSLDYGKLSAEIKTVDAQDSHEGGVLVLVTGYLTGKDNVKRNFTQTFFLAPQDKGYFVLNDMFRYVEDVNNEGDQGLASEVEAPLTPDQEPSLVQDNHVSEHMTVSSEDVNGEEVYDPSENGEVLIVEEEVPVAEVVDEIHDDSQLVTESNSKIEEVPRKSYASIVKVMKENGMPLSTTPAPPRAVPKGQEQQITATPLPATVAETSNVNSNAVDSGDSQEGEVEGYSIYIRGLPMSATPGLLEGEFKKFGAIKRNGIQVRSNKGFCFGFVEFEVANAVQNAIEASPITIGGRQAYVEEKRSTNSRGNNRGRFTNGRGGMGGFRNEGARGRGNYGGGRGYSRGDFSNRTEFGNRGNGRGGHSNRVDGYQRADHLGNNGGRMNRWGGMSVNATAKSMAPRVSAPA